MGKVDGIKKAWNAQVPSAKCQVPSVALLIASRGAAFQISVPVSRLTHFAHPMTRALYMHPTIAQAHLPSPKSRPTGPTEDACSHRTALQHATPAPRSRHREAAEKFGKWTASKKRETPKCRAPSPKCRASHRLTDAALQIPVPVSGLPHFFHATTRALYMHPIISQAQARPTGPAEYACSHRTALQHATPASRSRHRRKIRKVERHRKSAKRA
ncbi:hypothetical protein BH09MYX1_BH09MYX1_52780 [soil metagenome]